MVPMMSEVPLRLSGIEKRFGERLALAGVDLELRAGEILGVLGPNGAGKSTLVRMIMGRVAPDAGKTILFGQALAPGDKSRRAALGCVPQEIALYPLLSAQENLTVFGRYHGLSGKALASSIDRALQWAALADRKDEPVKTLSGGMKRRLNMAAGVLDSPRVLLLDEPTVGVDPQSRERMYEMIETLRGEGVSIFYTTHYMEEAERLCDRIIILDQGKAIATGTKKELVEKTFGLGREVVVDCEETLPPDVARELEGTGHSVHGSRITRFSDNAPEVMQQLFKILETRSCAIRDMRVQTPTLEHVFLRLTGRELRE
jgi:ABC-2 type transport system ATP-binding protein